MKTLLILLVMVKALMGEYSLVKSKADYLEIYSIMKSKGYRFKVTPSVGNYSTGYYTKGISTASINCVRLINPVAVQKVTTKSVYLYVGASIVCGSYTITELQEE